LKIRTQALILLIAVFLVASCGDQKPTFTLRPTWTPEPTRGAAATAPPPSATTLPQPTDTSAPDGVASATPSLSPEPTATATAEPESACGAAEATDDGKVLLGDETLLDTTRDAPGCFDVGEISYSPTCEHFLVVLSCFEGDNTAFLFKADGSDRREVTDEYDLVNYTEYEWAPDGRSFVYKRINSCCLSDEQIPLDAPVEGMVRYDVETGEKTLVSTFRIVNVASDDTLNVRSGPGVNNPVVGEIPPNGTGIEITGEPVVVDPSPWVPVRYGNLEGWVNLRFLELEATS
jgi:hypothetical protein